MKYTILLVALLFVASAFTFRLRSKAHARVTCPALEALDQSYTDAAEVCGPEAGAYMRDNGLTYAEANEYYYTCMGEKMGLEGTREAINQAWDDTESTCE